MTNENEEKKENVYEIEENNAIEFVNCVNDLMLNRGMYGLTRNELYDYLLYLLQKYESKGFYSNLSNYKLARKLKTTESKIKTAKLNIAQKHFTDDEYGKTFDTFLKEIAEENILIKDVGENYYEFTVESIVTRNALANQLKTIVKDTLDYSFNSEKIKISKESFLKLLQNYNPQNEFTNSYVTVLEMLQKDKKNNFVKKLIKAVLNNDKTFFINLLTDKALEAKK